VDETRGQVRSLALAATLLLLLGGSALSGDFGRPGPVGTFQYPPAAPLAGRFNDTDQELEMHDRIWRFLRAPRARSGGAVADYYLSLSRAAYASSHTRYRAVGDDVGADLGTLPRTFAAICAVENVDRQRGIALDALADMEAGMAKGVARSAQRNAGEIGQFVAALRFRFESYSYALDHLLVETPHEDVVEVDTQLAQLQVLIRRGERGQFCETKAPHHPHPGPVEQPLDLLSS
jgi:hypothetical protein